MDCNDAQITTVSFMENHSVERLSFGNEARLRMLIDSDNGRKSLFAAMVSNLFCEKTFLSVATDINEVDDRFFDETDNRGKTILHHASRVLPYADFSKFVSMRGVSRCLRKYDSYGNMSSFYAWQTKNDNAKHLSEIGESWQLSTIQKDALPMSMIAIDNHEAIRFFVHEGMDAQGGPETDPEFNSWLHHAVRLGARKTCAFLLWSDADPFKKNIHGRTPLSMTEKNTENGAAILSLLQNAQLQSKGQKIRHQSSTV